MTSIANHRPWTSPTLRNAMVVRQGIAWATHISAIGLMFRPLVVTLAIAAAAAMWPAHAHADGLGDANGSVLNGVGIGIGNNGPLSTTIASIGQSICPMLVQPGSKLASMATQMSGHDGLAPTIAGFVASTAIQTQCPSWMTSLANGEMPAGLQALISMAGPALQLPGGGTSGTPSPLALLGATPTTPSPFALPGASPAPVGLQIPGLQTAP